MVADTTLT